MTSPFFALFDPDDPDRAEQLYAELRVELVRYLAWQGCQTPVDAAQEVFVRAFRKLSEGAAITTPNPRAYFFGFARNLVKEGWKPSLETPLELEHAERFSASEGLDDALDAKHLLHRCLDALSEPDRRLIVDYYGSDRDREEIARELGMSVENLRVKVHRIRRKFEAVARVLGPDPGISTR